MATIETRGFWFGMAAAAGMTLSSVAGHASQPPNPTINNGSFSTNTGSGTSTTVTGTTANLSNTWTVATVSTNPNACVVYGNSFTNCGYTPISTAGLGVDPNGAPYFAAGSWTGTNAIISQTVSNLILNEKYNITFYQAALADAVVTDAARWTVAFGGAATQNSTIMNIASGLAVGWASQSMIFSASATSVTLSFLASGGTNSGPPLALLDGVAITRVPEPASIALLAIGAAGIMGLRRRRARLAV